MEFIIPKMCREGNGSKVDVGNKSCGGATWFTSHNAWSLLPNCPFYFGFSWYNYNIKKKKNSSCFIYVYYLIFDNVS